MLYAKCANSPDGRVTRFRETASPQKFYLRGAIQKINRIFWDFFFKWGGGGVYPIPKTFVLIKIALKTP